MLRREIDHARAGRPARVILKVNSLVDPSVIRILYEAARAGVQVDLVVRGICCLVPGAPGCEERIRVVSILGRFLEHSRVFYFLNGGEEEAWLGSADLMPRNLDHRIEVVFPVESPSLRRYLRDEVLKTCLRDNLRARRMRGEGTYERLCPAPEERPVDVQAHLAALRTTSRSLLGTLPLEE